MEGDGDARSRAGLAWDLGMQQWAPAASAAYPQHFLPPPPPGVASHHHHHQQHMQQELTSLKLGKRPCSLAGVQVAQVDGTGAAVVEGKRKEKAGAPATAAMPRCQVEGCHMVLAGAKEYHRRHKVCEAHSKAPRVIVHGAEQRFCQQCSRFHAMAEFDDAKRSCRRRLAGHNERRRKSNANDAMARGTAHAHGMASLAHGFAPYGGLPTSPAGALSLLSSARGAPWLVPTTPGDVFAARSSSAALDELIAENRAALLACHFFPQRSAAARPTAAEMAPTWQQAHQQAPPGHALVGNGVGVGQDHGAAAPAGHVTLDLMQAPSTAGLPFRPMAQGRPAGDGGAGRGSGVSTPMQGAHAV
ncbi:squamosa promoter-binding-like protein 7 [Hordeum vulgare]|nr:squamosa promoter-binding-like protein 7 [Hordeum vulgare]